MSDIKFEGENLDPARLPIPLGWHVVVGMINISEKSEGGIVLVNQSIKNEQYFRSMAKVLAVGPDAYQAPKFQGEVPLTNGKTPKPWVSVGDIVFIDKNSGKKLEFIDPETDQVCALKIINDENILAIMPDPSLFII
jgi:co-chaperonin GroES (HSP10)